MPWLPYVLGVATIVPMLGVMIFRTRAWLVIEKAMLVAFVLVAGGVMLLNLGELVSLILRQPGKISGLSLLASAIAIWAGNVVLFSIVYWFIDGRGPEARVRTEPITTEWLFPQLQIPGASAKQWRPVFADYLYLAYSTATAFSACDVLPATPRAKMLMLVESMISLITIVIVAARAVNILA